VTTDDQKVEAMRVALPESRYKLIVAYSKAECLSMLTGGRAKHMPDVVLLDSELNFGMGRQVCGERGE